MRRGLIIFLFVVFLSGGFFILQNYSQASVTPIELIRHDGTIINNPNWIYTDCATSSAGYLILNLPDSTLVSPSIIIPSCNTAQLNFLARTYYGAKFNEKTKGTSSEIYIYAKVDGLEELVTVAYNPTTNSSPESMPEVDFTKYCGKEIYLIFKSPNAVTSSNPTMSKGFGLDEISLSYTPIEINQIPIANAGLDREGIIDEELEFSDAGSTDSDGTVVGWFWNFGSTTKTGSTVYHAFSATGTHSVYLSVIDNSGATSSPDELSVLITTNGSITTTTSATSTPTSTETIINPSDLVINEVLPAPTDGDEWLELYNKTSKTIDLSKLVLLDLRAGKFVTTTLSGSIGPQEFVVVRDVVGSLNNTGDTLVLQRLDGLIIDSVTYPSFSTVNHSWARKYDGVDTNSDSDFALTIRPTPGAKNIIEAKPVTVSSGGSASVKIEVATTTKITTSTTTATTTTVETVFNLIINELLPNPDGPDDKNEFIEIKNIGATEINLQNFYLSDGSGKKYVFKSASSTLSAGGILAIYSAESKISLNNTGWETVSLFSPTGQEIDRVEYLGNNKKDWSYARDFEDEWYWTEKATPNADNIFSENIVATEKTAVVKTATKTTAQKAPVSNTFSAVSIEGIRNLEIGAKIKTVGIVTALPGSLGSQYFYLADSQMTAGVQVYSYKKDFPELKIGNKVGVVGELSKINGENRIKTKTRSDIKIIDTGSEPAPLLVEELSEEDLGALIKISGEIIEIKGRNIYLDYGNGEAKIYLKTSIKMEDLSLKPSDKMEIVGILSATTAGLRLLPRNSADLKILPGEVKGEFEKAVPSSWPWQKYWPIFAIVGCLLVAWLVSRELLKAKI